MTIKDIIKRKKNTAYIILLGIVIAACLWSFIYAGILTKNFKNKIKDQTYANKEANIENLLITETKEGEKLWEMYADTGRYSDTDNMVILDKIIGNLYKEKAVKASFKAERGTYNSLSKEIILYDNVVIVNDDGTNIMADKIDYKGKDQDITAEGNVRIEKPDEAILFGGKAVLKGDFSDFHIEGRTKTQFYM